MIRAKPPVEIAPSRHAPHMFFAWARVGVSNRRRQLWRLGATHTPSAMADRVWAKYGGATPVLFYKRPT